MSAETFAALQEFYTEEEQRESVKAQIEQVSSAKSMECFQEDWNLSQFWYDEDTAFNLAKVLVKMAGKDGKIACISAPTAFVAIKKHFPEAKGNFRFISLHLRF